MSTTFKIIGAFPDDEDEYEYTMSGGHPQQNNTIISKDTPQTLPPPPSPPSYQPRRPKLTRSERRAVTELQHFMRFCLTIDYLPILYGSKFRETYSIPTHVDTCHKFSTPSLQWQDLSRYLRGPQTDGQVYRRWGGLKTYHRPQEDMAEYLMKTVFAPADYLGLDRGQMIERVRMYLPRDGHSGPRSALRQMAEEARWADLAEKVLRDGLCFQTLFSGSTVFDTKNESMTSLEVLVEESMKYVQAIWFLELGWKENGSVKYEVSAIPQAIFAETKEEISRAMARRGAAVFKRPEQVIRPSADCVDSPKELKSTPRLSEKDTSREATVGRRSVSWRGSRDMSKVAKKEEQSHLELQLRSQFGLL